MAQTYARRSSSIGPLQIAIIALVVEPFLTVASQPAYEMGQRATELLLQRIIAPEATPYQEVILPTQLIIRQSCRAV